jgi:hypothetical protein
MSESELPEYRIAKLHLEPGDTLVAKVDRELSMEVLARLRDHLGQAVSPQIKVMVIGPGIDLQHVKPPVPDA